MTRRHPTQCPVCEATLTVAELRCRECDSSLRGTFAPSRCPFCALPEEQFRFLELFLRCRGNLRDVERSLGLSYPTVRARLDVLLATLGYTAASASDTADQRREVLEALNNGSLTAEEAIELLEKL